MNPRYANPRHAHLLVSLTMNGSRSPPRSFVLDVIAFVLASVRSPLFNSIITDQVASLFKDDAATAVYTRVAGVMVISLGVLRLGGAIHHRETGAVRLAQFSYAAEFAWYLQELLRGTISFEHTTIAECLVAAPAPSLCSARTVVPAMTFCCVMFLALHRKK
jgi:hypothetical protein